MSIHSYRKKRNFRQTSEPKSRPRLKSQVKSSPASSKRAYLIQKHAARHLHYDLRLEMNRVLKSWAIPKKPSLNGNVKRLTIAVEDHPLSYAKFEGIIPKGQYGAGVVTLWDTGTYQTKHSPLAEYKKGDITLEITGRKLKGHWKLIKIKSNNGKNNQWLFFKIKKPIERL